MKLVNIGYGNLVNSSRIVAVVSPDAAPIKRLVQDTRTAGKLIDASGGKKTRAVLIADSGHIILSALTTETLLGRINGTDAQSGGEETTDNG